MFHFLCYGKVYNMFLEGYYMLLEGYNMFSEGYNVFSKGYSMFFEGYDAFLKAMEGYNMSLTNMIFNSLCYKYKYDKILHCTTK